MMDPELVNGDDLSQTLAGLFHELLRGPQEGAPTWITTGGPGSALYGSLADLSAEQASQDVNGSSIAAHAEHMRWALQLVIDWFEGKGPTADWNESWSVSVVDEAAWDKLRADLRVAGDTVLENLRTRHSWNAPMAMNGALASYGHAAYHLGAIRQLRKEVM